MIEDCFFKPIFLENEKCYMVRSGLTLTKLCCETVQSAMDVLDRFMFVQSSRNLSCRNAHDTYVSNTAARFVLWKTSTKEQ